MKTSTISNLVLAMALSVSTQGIAAEADENGIIYSDAATNSCRQNSADFEEAQGCVGLSSNQCQTETPGGYSTFAIAACLDYELTYWDAALNDIYQTMRTEAGQLDAQNGGSSAPSTKDALVAMQRAWIPYRDATCSFEASQWGGGTGAGPAYVGCLLRLTAEQTVYLNYSGLGG
jgi:uncharacterized protein YecT (DUF1311 family)